MTSPPHPSPGANDPARATARPHAAARRRTATLLGVAAALLGTTLLPGSADAGAEHHQPAGQAAGATMTGATPKSNDGTGRATGAGASAVASPGAGANADATEGANANTRAGANTDEPEYSPDKIVVQYRPRTSAAAASASTRAAGAFGEDPIDSAMRVLTLRHGVTVTTALARLRHRRQVAWVAPDYIAHEASAGSYIPDDPGLGGAAGDWQQLQWNFDGPFGVNAPEAWANLNADGRPGGQGVIVAVLDTGVAYANRGKFRRSPDFTPYQFVAGYDFVAGDPYANDRNGHGTDVASTIAEATNNGYGLTGLAYGVRIMPVRVLNAEGDGEASEIARGVVFAVKHHAQVINLSLEFSSDVTARDIPELISALKYAHSRGVLVVAAAGNEGSKRVPYPARDPNVISVGATTEHGCMAAYSNYGHRVTLVAPGGGPDASIPGDPDCHPEDPPGRDIYQVTFAGSSPRRFGIPSGYEGTSMAAPHVSATAALIIASGVLGPHPTPAQITARLKATARPLGDPADRYYYGAGLVNAAAATEPGGPGAVAATPATETRSGR